MKPSTLLFLLAGLALPGGLLALANPFAASLSVNLFIGWLFVIVGGFGLAAAFRLPTDRLGSLVVALMTLLVGLVMLTNPMSGLVALTILVAIGFLLSGVGRIVLARAHQDHPAFWVLLFSGAVSILLGAMIFANFPQSAEIILGVFLGIELLSVAITFGVLGLAFRQQER